MKTTLQGIAFILMGILYKMVMPESNTTALIFGLVGFIFVGTSFIKDNHNNK